MANIAAEGSLTEQEEPLFPDLPIIDTHVHLWRVNDYFAGDYLADVERSGHAIEKSVYIECSMSYSDDPREEYRPAGEVAYVVGQVRQAANANHDLAAGIVAAADLRIGANIEPVLETLDAVSDGRLRGIRYRIAYDADPVAGYPTEQGGYPYPVGNVLDDAQFLDGARHVAKRGLHFETWGFHPQLEDIARFAAKVPDLIILINHCGGPLGVGRYAGRRQAVYEDWRKGLRAAAKQPNVFVKVSGLAIGRLGFGLVENGPAVSSDQLVDLWKPYVKTLVDEFTPERLVFSPGFPADKPAGSLRIVINAYKKMVADLSDDDKRAFFAGNARRLYRL